MALTAVRRTARSTSSWPVPGTFRGLPPAPGGPVAFCREMLPRTSRTFALTVPLLPSPLDDIVATAYLLCRVADTVEDEADLPADLRVELLRELGVLVALPADWPAPAADFSARACRLLESGTTVDQVRLVAGVPVLLAGLAGQSDPVRELVRTCLQDMIAGMRDTLLRGEARRDRWPVVDDLEEVRAYCDIVAGTVGRMLTGLFAWHSGGVAAVTPALEARAAAFGRALQLTNILKDVRADLDAGRCWLPGDVLAEHGIDAPGQLGERDLDTRARGVLAHMIAAAHREITQAVEYVETLPAADAAIRRFCVAPLLLAVLTLRKLWGSRDVFGATPVKISRRAVSAALIATRVTASRPATVGPLFATLRQPLPRPLPQPHAQPPPVEPDRTMEQGVAAAATRLAATQSPTGSWDEDYGGALFLLPLYVVTCYLVGAMPDERTCVRIEHHFRTHQNPDGGWGLNTESHSEVFSTVLAYTALRLLGVSADDPRLRRARAWFLARGGPPAAAEWGKFFLALLGLYDWKGLFPVLPELWIIPRALAIHPSRLWCHTRLAYLPMSWLYGRRPVANDDPLLRELRDELYPTPYEDVDWTRTRAAIAVSDAYRPRSWLLRATYAVLSAYERRPSRFLRTRAMATVLDHVDHEDRSSNYLCVSPVNKMLNTLVWHYARPNGEELAAHLKRLPEYLWDAADGTKTQAYNSAETWNTAFAVHAMTASRHPDAERALRPAAEFLERNQCLDDVEEAARYFRHSPYGGWPFSTREQGWPVADCTAEALSAVLALDELGLVDAITPRRRLAAVEYLLSLQNRDGGWPTYEPTRGPRWLEKLNPSDSFDHIMIDYSHVELTASCLQALRHYRTRHPRNPPAALDAAISRGERFLLSTQRADGSWEGFWGVCFTYGTWFGVRGLADSDTPHATAAIDRACEFLIAHQQTDGGWGESVDGCRKRHYVHTATGQAVMTSWALLTLVQAGRAASPSVRRGTGFLLRTQQPDGTWPEEHLAGVTTRTLALNYDVYRRVFPLWALSMVANATDATGRLVPRDQCRS